MDKKNAQHLFRRDCLIEIFEMAGLPTYETDQVTFSHSISVGGKTSWLTKFTFSSTAAAKTVYNHFQNKHGK